MPKSKSKRGTKSTRGNAIEPMASDSESPNHTVEPKLGKTPCTRSRSKRSNDSTELSGQPKSKRTRRSLSTEPSNNVKPVNIGNKSRNAQNGAKQNVDAIDPNQVVVGSARSLINSIKSRRATAARGDNVANESSDEDLDKHDGISVGINTSEDDISDGQVNTLSESESDASETQDSSGPSSGKSKPGTQIDDEGEDPEIQFNKNAKSKARRFPTGTDLHNDSFSPSESEGDVEAELKALKKDPKVRRILNILVDEKMEKQRRRRRARSKRARRSRSRSYRSRSCSRSRSRSRSRRPSRNRGTHKTSKERNAQLKSPSDTTLYKQALRKLVEGKVTSPSNRINQNQSRKSSLVDQVSNFIAGVRAGMERDEVVRHRSRSASRWRERSQTRDPPRNANRRNEDENQHDDLPEVRQATELADQMVLDAEKFRATVNAPQKGITEGGTEYLSELINAVKKITDNDDDDYFHVTSHLDKGLKLKIQAGDFVELE